MKNHFKKINILYITLVTILFYSCSKDDPDGINEQEYISNVVFSVTSPDGTLQTIDWDLSETNMETINLKANTNYSVGLTFENRSDPTDIEDITQEIIEEADEHQVFFEFADVSVNVTSANNDTNLGTCSGWRYITKPKQPTAARLTSSFTSLTATWSNRRTAELSAVPQ